MINHVRAVFLTIWAVELITRFLRTIGFDYTIDSLTVYLLVWQFTSTGLRFISQQLNSPIMILEQGFFCIFAAIISYAGYDSFGRYVPFQVNLLFFWLWSFMDM